MAAKPAFEAGPPLPGAERENEDAEYVVDEPTGLDVVILRGWAHSSWFEQIARRTP